MMPHFKKRATLLVVGGSLLEGRSRCRLRSAEGFSSPPTESHSSPISTFDGTLIDDMSLETSPSEDSVSVRLTPTHAVNPTYDET